MGTHSRWQVGRYVGVCGVGGGRSSRWVDGDGDDDDDGDNTDDVDDDDA